MTKEVEVKGGSTVSGSGFRATLRKHSNLLTFIGAFIVFATFIIREEVREDLKDIVNSIDSAQAVFATRHDVNVIADQLDSVALVVDHLYLNAVLEGHSSAANAAEAVLALLVRAVSIKNFVGALGAHLDNVSRLLEKIGPNQDQGVRSTKLRYRAKELQKRCEETIKYLKSLTSKAESVPGQRALSLYITGEYMNRIGPLLRDTPTLSHDVQRLGEEVLTRAERVKALGEKRFRHITWLSIGLYALGWGLGLASKILGVETVGADN